MLLRLVGKSAYHIVGFIARHLNHRNTETVQNLLDVGHGSLDILRRSLALSLVALIRLVAECRTRRVEAHGNVSGILLLQHLKKGVEEAESRRSVKPCGGNTGRIDKRIIGAENQRVGIKQK